MQQYDKKFELARNNAELEKQLAEQQELDLQEIKDRYDAIAKEKEEKAKADKLKQKEEERLADLSAIDESLEYATQAANSIQALGNAVFANKMKNLEE